jgi:hypothetical protein
MDVQSLALAWAFRGKAREKSREKAAKKAGEGVKKGPVKDAGPEPPG